MLGHEVAVVVVAECEAAGGAGGELGRLSPRRAHSPEGCDEPEIPRSAATPVCLNGPDVAHLVVGEPVQAVGAALLHGGLGAQEKVGRSIARAKRMLDIGECQDEANENSVA